MFLGFKILKKKKNSIILHGGYNYELTLVVHPVYWYLIFLDFVRYIIIVKWSIVYFQCFSKKYNVKFSLAHTFLFCYKICLYIKMTIDNIVS